jgi:hypothetical protein
METGELEEAVDDDIAAPLTSPARPDADGEMLDDEGDSPNGEEPSTATLEDVEPATEPDEPREISVPSRCDTGSCDVRG